MNVPQGLPELPEQSGMRAKFDKVHGWWVFDGDPKNFSEAEARAYGLACYRAGMEKAAEVCDAMTDFHGYPAGAAIRAEMAKQK
jgi:hypothetical protein